MQTHTDKQALWS